MKQSFVLVADAGKARLFKFDKKSRSLDEIQDLIHPESRLRAQETDSDKPGRHTGGVSGSRHSVNPRDERADHEEEVFARQLGELLEAERIAHRYEALVLMAAPRFLGKLREQMTDQCASLVVATVDKNLVSQSSEAILERVLKF